MVEGVRGNDRIAVVKRLRPPDDRGQEERDLHDIGDDLIDVAKPCAQHAEDQYGPKQIHHDAGNPGQRQQADPTRHLVQRHYHDEIYDKVMGHHDGVAASYAIDEDRQRQPDLPDQRFVAYEGDAAFRNGGQYQAPGDEAAGQVRYVSGDIFSKQRTIDDSHRADHHAHADGEPEWSKQRSAIALFDVMPTQQYPDTPLPQAGYQVTKRFA